MRLVDFDVYILTSPLFILFFGGGFLTSFIWSFLATFFQIHLLFDRLFSEPNFSFNPPQVAQHWTATQSKKAYNTEQDTTSLRDDVQLSREIPFTYMSSNFIMFFYLTYSYRHSKLKKGMEVQEHVKKQLKLYKNTFCQLFHCKIQTFH